MDTWKNIDPSVAERQLFGLRRRLSELDHALKANQIALRETPDSFSFKLAAQSLLAMQENLRGELSALLRHRVAENINVVLDGPSFDGHSTDFLAFGRFLINIQKLYTSIAQAIVRGPTLRGPISKEIESSTQLRLLATYPSSFGINVGVESNFDILGHSVASDSLEALFALLHSSSEETSLMRLKGELGARAFNHLRRLMVDLGSREAELKVGWHDFTGTEYNWEITSERTNNVIRAIDNINFTESSEIILEGFLVGASLLRNRFEFLTLEDQTLLEGKVVAGINPKLRRNFGLRCFAKFKEISVLDKGTDETRKYYTLLDIAADAADLPAPIAAEPLRQN
jgi:hypothetical protein